MRANYFSIFDIVPALIWLVILILLANSQRNKKKGLDYYRFFMPNLYVKFFFALAFSLFYIVMYKGGDTVAYFEVSRSLNKLLVQNPVGWWEQMTSGPSWEMQSRLFNYQTGYPPGWIYREEASLFVSKVFSFIAMIGLNSYFATTLIIAFITAKASWRLYELALSYGLHDQQWLAYGILFLPSVNFWCTGISKDALVFISALYLIYHLFQVINVNTKATLRNYLWIIFFGFLIYNTRSFILVAIGIPAILAYITRYLKKRAYSEGSILGVYIFLMLVGLAAFGGTLANQSEAELLASSSTLQEAQITQQDFAINQTYGTKRYSLGDVDFSPMGLLRTAPLAIFAGIYYPLPWQSLSPTLLFNGIESMIIIWFTLLFIWRSPWKKFKKINSNELLVFALIFTFLIAFMAGFTSILYGVLVRIRAPLLPFLFIILTIDWKALLPAPESPKKKEDLIDNL